VVQEQTVLRLVEQVIPSALAPMEISTATIQLSSRLAVLTARETAVILDTSVLRMLRGKLGAALMHVSLIH
jgi:hypothetical protein